MGVSGSKVGEGATLALVADLCARLDAAGVRYCHFKSNAALDRSRTGRNDLDLLVHRADAGRFRGTLADLGFKPAAVHPLKALPGVSDHYGHDAQSGRLVHVHAHHQLVVGDDRTKNYRIPLESAYLSTAVSDGEFPVPTRELELILLVIRLILKHATWDAFVARLTRIPASAGEELDFLLARADRDRVNRDLERWLPAVDPATFAACLAALRPGGGRVARMRAGDRLLKALEPYARRPRRIDVGLKFARRGTALARRFAQRPVPGRRLQEGGAVIAFIGADGAGKSTAIDEIHRWLGRSFSVTRVHLGRPPRTRVMRLGRALALVPSVPEALVRRHTPLGGRDRPQRPRRDAVLAVLLARDRYVLARSARRAATNGELVVCDRFPLPQLTVMDAPRVMRILPAQDGLGRRLAALEQRYYRAMVPPDVLVVLMVEPDIAVARKTEEPEDFIRSRWAQMWQVDWVAAGAHVIDAGRPLDEVHAAIRSVIWSEI